MEADKRPVVLSGIQPTGSLNIGTYLGALKNWVALQDEYDSIFLIVDLHALTVSQTPADLRRRCLDYVAQYVACGIDTEKSTIAIQSHIPQHAELGWVLNTMTYMGELNRMTQFKDKSKKHEANLNAGLFSYPVLMAADILAVQSNLVPVGQDQKQHVEVTRDLAIKFNHEYEDVFTIPESQIQENVAVIPGTDGQKMSKSYGNTIDIFSSKKKVRQSIMRIVTDSKTLEEAKVPDTCNIFALYKLFATESECQDLADRYRAGGMGYGDAKKELFAKFEAHFAPMRAKREDLEKNLDYVESVLADGAERARATITPTLDAARTAMGLA